MMSVEIEVRHDKKRGCGYRKPGGLYLVGPPTGAPCGRLPLALETCPCCAVGIKPSRSWTWINPRLMFKNSPPCGYDRLNASGLHLSIHSTCPANQANMPEKAGLLWVGGKFYDTPESFMYEAAAQGISRRIPALPKDFEPGKTWVFLAHRDCIKDGVDEEGQPKFKRGVFSIFRPSAVEYVVKGDESDEKLERLVNRGITPVRVEPVADDNDEGDPSQQ